MSDTSTPLTAASSVGAWLAHPVGSTLLRELLAKGGMEESVLAPVSGLPLQTLADMSQGQMPQEVIDELVLAANGGVMPTTVESSASALTVPERFAGRTIIVTGAGSGIGRAVASRIVREGGRVIGVDVNEVGLATVANELATDRLNTVTADITKAEDISRVLAAAGGVIDGLANIAGIVDDFSAIHETSDAVWKRVFSVNVDGIFLLCRAVVPSMLAVGRGAIVNIASEAGLRGNAAGVAYTASKHAVIGITRSMAFMYGTSGIRTNAVAPGGVATGLAPSSYAPFGQQRTAPFMQLITAVATAEQLAASITFLLSDDGVNINGAVLPSDGGWSVQ